MPVCAHVELNRGKQVDLNQKKTKRRTEQKEEKQNLGQRRSNNNHLKLSVTMSTVVLKSVPVTLAHVHVRC